MCVCGEGGGGGGGGWGGGGMGVIYISLHNNTEDKLPEKQTTKFFLFFFLLFDIIFVVPRGKVDKEPHVYQTDLFRYILDLSQQK